MSSALEKKSLQAENLHPDSKGGSSANTMQDGFPHSVQPWPHPTYKKIKTKLAQCITEAINKQNNTGGKRNAKERKKELDRD